MTLSSSVAQNGQRMGLRPGGRFLRVALDHLDAPLVAAADELRRAKDPQRGFGDPGTDDARTERDDIGIIVSACSRSREVIVHERRAYAWHLVGRDADPDPGAAHDEAIRSGIR